MKFQAKLLSIFLLVSLSSCFDEEEFPDTPKIEFESLEFIDSNTSVDSLSLTFHFEDGGANIGIVEDEDIFFPFNQYLVFVDENDSLVTLSRLDRIEGPVYLAQLITRTISLTARGGDLFYSLDGTNHAVLAFDKVLYEGGDPNIGPEITQEDFSCPNLFNQDLNGLRLYGSSSDVGLDVYSINDNVLTVIEYDVDEDLLVLPVDSHYNLFVTFKQRVIGGSFEEVNFRELFQNDDCLFGNFNGRIPWFSQDGESGSITYNIISRGLSIAFQENDIRLVFSVLDRNGNRSNTDSVDFTLQQIQVN